LYQTLLPLAHDILSVILNNEFEESTAAVVRFIMTHQFQDGTYISYWVPSEHYSEDMTKARMLEALAHWIRGKARILDKRVPLPQVAQQMFSGNLIETKRKLEMAVNYQGLVNEVLTEFIFAVVVNQLGEDAACLGNAVAAMLTNQVERQLLYYVEYPSMLLAEIVRRLEEIQAKVSKVVMEMYSATGMYTYEESKEILIMFFQYYTVETGTGTLDVHETCEDAAFIESPFQVNLIDSFGCLMKLLIHLEGLCDESAAFAVDFEGVKLSRNGALCLVQMTCYENPRLVYVLDVHVLGRRTFTMKTPNGTSMKGLLEEQSIRKVWFDPRNDVDALYHQFGVLPKGIVDLQLAEVADRRSRGLNVHYVQGLYKCLTQCPALQSEQKVFAEKINGMGKSLFEPLNGGAYEVFQHRPLHPVLLVYSAHDSRYMLALYEQYVQSIGEQWLSRVLLAGDQRGRWCLSREYVVPSSEAPDF
jgi:hypothetical protein